VVSKSHGLRISLLVASALALSCAGVDPPSGPDGGRGDGGVGSGGGSDAAVIVDLAPPIDLMAPPDLVPACVDANTPCSTGNPGACGLGHAHCVNNVLTCVPDATVQACYNGPAGTQGHGLCKAGTQTCIGTLGECQGEIVPSRENCFNDLDDDCDDRIDNGCPTTVFLGAPRALAPVGGTGGGMVSSARCPTNSYVVRTQILFDDGDTSATGVRVFCATPSLVRGASSYSISLAPVSASPSASFLGARYTPPDEDVSCTTNGFVAAWTTAGWSDTYVRGFWPNCANGTITLNADNTLSYSLAKNGMGGSVGYQIGTPFEEACDASEVLIGYDARLGFWMDQLTPICAPLQTLYK